MGRDPAFRCDGHFHRDFREVGKAAVQRSAVSDTGILRPAALAALCKLFCRIQQQHYRQQQSDLQNILPAAHHSCHFAGCWAPGFFGLVYFLRAPALMVSLSARLEDPRGTCIRTDRSGHVVRSRTADCRFDRKVP